MRRLVTLLLLFLIITPLLALSTPTIYYASQKPSWWNNRPSDGYAVIKYLYNVTVSFAENFEDGVIDNLVEMYNSTIYVGSYGYGGTSGLYFHDGGTTTKPYIEISMWSSIEDYNISVQIAVKEVGSDDHVPKIYVKNGSATFAGVKFGDDMFIYIYDAVAGSWINTTVPYSLESWQNVTIALHGESYDVYVNGTSVGSQSFAGDWTASPVLRIEVGGTTWGIGEAYVDNLEYPTWQTLVANETIPVGDAWNGTHLLFPPTFKLTLSNVTLGGNDTISPHLWDWSLDGVDDSILADFLDSEEAYSKFSVETYVRCDAILDNYGAALGTLAWSFVGGFVIFYDPTVNCVTFRVRDSIAGVEIRKSFEHTIHYGAWRRYTGVFDKPYVYTYTNGSLMGSKAWDYYVRTNGGIKLGDWSNTHIKGKMAYVKVYNRTLSQEEITEYRIVNSTNLLLFLDATFFNGTYYLDISGYDNHATPRNGIQREEASGKWLWLLKNLETDNLVHFRFFPSGTQIIVKDSNGNVVKSFVISGTPNPAGLVEDYTVSINSLSGATVEAYIPRSIYEEGASYRWMLACFATNGEAIFSASSGDAYRNCVNITQTTAVVLADEYHFKLSPESGSAVFRITDADNVQLEVNSNVGEWWVVDDAPLVYGTYNASTVYSDTGWYVNKFLPQRENRIHVPVNPRLYSFSVQDYAGMEYFEIWSQDYVVYSYFINQSSHAVWLEYGDLYTLYAKNSIETRGLGTIVADDVTSKEIIIGVRPQVEVPAAGRTAWSLQKGDGQYTFTIEGEIPFNVEVCFFNNSICDLQWFNASGVYAASFTYLSPAEYIYIRVHASPGWELTMPLSSSSAGNASGMLEPLETSYTLPFGLTWGAVIAVGGAAAMLLFLGVVGMVGVGVFASGAWLAFTTFLGFYPTPWSVTITLIILGIGLLMLKR